MKANLEKQTGEGNAPRVSVFGYYKGHCIEGVAAGRAQNVFIDGKCAGHLFGGGVIAVGRSIIDTR